MKYYFEKVIVNTLIENRHLFIDDVKYNSLVLSNLIGKPINLYSGVMYHDLSFSSREKLYNMNQGKYYMFTEQWLYQVVCIRNNTSPVLYDTIFVHWDDLEAVAGGYNEIIPLLTLK